MTALKPAAAMLVILAVTAMALSFAWLGYRLGQIDGGLRCLVERVHDLHR